MQSLRCTLACERQVARLQRELADLREECERTAARLTAERERCVDAEAARVRLAAQAAVDHSRCSDLELELATTTEASTHCEMACAALCS